MNGSISISKVMLFMSVAVVLLAPLTGCSKEEAWKSPVKIFDTRLWHKSGGEQKAFWLNEQIIAFTVVGNDEDGLFGAEERMVNMFHAGRMLVEKYSSGTILCCANGNNISFVARDYKDEEGKWRRIRKQGEVGREFVLDGIESGKWTYDWRQNGRPWSQPEGKVFNEYVCDYQDDPGADADNRIIKYLRPEHGYLDFGEKGLKNGFNQLTVFVRASDGERLKMPFTLETTNDRIDYYPIDKRYLLWRTAKEVMGRQGWAGYEVLPAWWLSPEGEVEEIYIPAEPWAKWGVSSFRHTARGYLIHSIDIKRGGQIGESGLYLTDLTPNRYMKVVAGVIKEVEVSPDGCRVFFSEIPRVGDRLADSLMEETVPYPSVPRWKLIDLCRDLPEGVLNHG